MNNDFIIKSAREMLEAVVAAVAGVLLNQPDHGPGHVKNPQDLREGRWYIRHYDHLDITNRILVIEKREQGFRIRSANGYESDLSYRDFGLRPYESALGEATWNPHNWIEELQ